MTDFDLNEQVGRLVAEKPARARVFETHGIDYCCGGNKTLVEACEIRGIDLDAVVGELKEVPKGNGSLEEHPLDMTLTQLADHIELKHHGYLRRELPRLQALIEKVVKAHGANHTWLDELKTTFAELVNELVPHMAKEEQILFPIVRELDQSVVTTVFHCGSVNNPIRGMEHEHHEAGDALRKIRQLTLDFTDPADACNSFKQLMDGLRELEQDLHVHMHKENNILFPRASVQESMSR